MALRTWTTKIGDRQIGIKAKKDTAERFAYHLREVTKVTQMVRELTGIIGQTEGWDREASHTSMALFGPSGHALKDKAGYEKDVQEFIASLPELIEESQISTWNAKVGDLIDTHIPVVDKRKTPEQAAVEANERDRVAKEREEEQAAKQVAATRQADELVKQYPYLETMKRSGKSRNAAASTNLKTELQRAFPGVLFSVKSNTYSMGSSLSVKWTDGPTAKQVKEYSDKYQTKHFDGMTDSESSVATVFNDVFGGCGYVFEEREISEDLLIEAAASLGFDFGADEWRQFAACAHQDGDSVVALQNIRNTAHETPRMPAAGIAVPAPDRPEQDKAGYGDVTVSLNAERQGVEVRFKAKPERDTIDQLKAHGFRWSPKQKLWYAKQRDSRIRFAFALAGTDPKGGAESGGVDPLTEEQDRAGIEFCPSDHGKEVAA